MKFCFTLLICSMWLLSSSQDINFNQKISKVPAYAKFTDPGYQVWCASMIKGEDNKYYLFYSRWPDSLKHTNWVTHSEIALAVAENPLGPYKFLKVVLPKRAKKYWDADVTHNPTIHKFGNKYYLYYMGNYGNGEFWDNRNHQRIGVAISTSILGPWKRSEKPLVDISPGYDSLMVSNPAVTRTIDGKYAMVYKSVGHGPAPFGGKVRHRIAFSSKPDGKFVKQPNPIFSKDTVKFAAEDPFVWVQHNKYWALVKDFNGSFTGQGLSVALFESDDAINWKPAKHALASRIEIPWADGTEKVKKLERPQLYFEKGIPKVLFVAVMDTQDKSYIAAIPLDSTEDLDIGAMVRPVPQNAVFSEKDYFVWCGAMVKGHDDKYHLFYSRWPKKSGHAAWATQSEIAHAVAENPDGPYKFVNVVLKARNRKYWDGAATHNPTVLFKNGKYYLYYMGTTGTGKINYPTTMKDSAWWEYRNNQRIGVAVTANPAGIWKRLDKPVLDVGDANAYDGLMVSNPAVTFNKDNKVVLVYKQVENNKTLKGGKVKFGVAFSDSPFGPFKKETQPVFEVKSAVEEWMVAEDPYIWFQNDNYFAVVRDVLGKYTGQEGALALLISKDAKQWQAAKHPLVLGKTFKLENGTDSGTKLERPQLYFENGVPKILFGAVDDNREGYRENSFNIRVPLKPVNMN